MELGQGRPMFARFCGAEFEAMADLLDEVVEVIRERARRLAGVTRLHEPTPPDPRKDIAAIAAEYPAPRPALDGEALFRAAEGDVDAEVIELDPARDDNRPEDNGKRKAS